jgi:prepilin-type N-terminal cleavage/methylation domain-containing protein
MSHLNRRGLSMVELLVALVLLGIVTAALYRVLVNNQRIYDSQTQRIDLQQNIRAATTVLPADLREMDASEGDITSASATDITFRAMRWMGITCSPPFTGPLETVEFTPLTLTVMNQKLVGQRSPQVGDSVLIRYEGDEGSRLDDAWVPGRIRVINSPVNCPAGAPYDGKPGQQLIVDAYMRSVDAPPAIKTPNHTNSIYAGAPVRGFVAARYSLYQPAGDTSWYVGLTRSGSPIQPIIGPVLPNGLSFTYWNDTTAPQLNPGVATELVRTGSILFTLRARTQRQVRGQVGTSSLTSIIDSVTVRVSLRNNRRY